jgi:Uncharacterised nucleotidyltransferase
VRAAPQGPTTVALAAHGFAVDRVTAEVMRSLGAAGIRSVLLKGPALTGWLYAGDEARLYGDTDLLLRGGDWERAQELLAGLGFEDDLGPLAHPRMESEEGYPWWRPRDEAAVDLHLTLFGIGAAPGAVWAAFSRDAVVARVGGAEVLMPSHPARLLHVALHAVQHGAEASPKAMVDLERGLELAPAATWERAHELALELDAAPAFAAGLGLTAAGRRLATALGVEAGGSQAARLRIAKVPLAEGFAELAAAPGARGKLALLRRELFPTPAFMRWWTPLARRGRLGLALAYPWRWAWLAARAVPGYRAWRRERGGGR